MTTETILSGTRLARDNENGLKALLEAEADTPLFGPGAHAHTRIVTHVQTKAEVDAFAAKRGVTARWDLECGLYAAKAVNAAAERVVLFVGPEAQAVA